LKFQSSALRCPAKPNIGLAGLTPVLCGLVVDKALQTRAHSAVY